MDVSRGADAHGHGCVDGRRLGKAEDKQRRTRDANLMASRKAMQLPFFMSGHV